MLVKIAVSRSVLMLLQVLNQLLQPEICSLLFAFDDGEDEDELFLWYG